MGVGSDSCCILNNGLGSWAFDSLARHLSETLGLDVSDAPRDYNYLLLAEDIPVPDDHALFIPFRAMKLASDKRLLASVFAEHGVPTPETHLLSTMEEVQRFRLSRLDKEWCVKYPIGCGGSGHRLLSEETHLPASWPTPFVVQEFIRLECPEVYRLYGAAGATFGWVARRFPPHTKKSPWVAHARGARYEDAGTAPPDAIHAGRLALHAVGLLETFGCVDLLQEPSGEWLVLEVGTDGMFNHVDRDLGVRSLEVELRRRVAESFWARTN